MARGAPEQARRLGWSAWRWLASPDGSFAVACGITPTGATIVRPDGYVGWRTPDGAGASRDNVARVHVSLLGRDEVAERRLTRSGAPAACGRDRPSGRQQGRLL